MIKVNYSIDYINGEIKNGIFTFDNPIQRGLVWNRRKKSYLVHSIVVGYPIDTVYANRIGDIYDVFDGQQRLTSLYQYKNGEFKLSALPPVIVINNKIEDLTILCFDQLPVTMQNNIINHKFKECKIDDNIKKKEFKEYPQELKNFILECEEVFDLSGKIYELLPKIVQQAICKYSIDFHYGENLSQSQIAILFDRLNSGKPLTATEKAKAQILSPQVVEELRNHPIFTKIMSKESVIAKTANTYIMQSYVVLFDNESKCLLGSAIQDTLSKYKITTEQKDILKTCFDVYSKSIEILEQCTHIFDKKLLRIFRAKSHFSSLLPIAKQVIDNNIDINCFIDWLRYFFGTDAGVASISEEYNSKLKNAMNSSDSVKTRINAAKNSFNEYLKNPQIADKQLSL